MTELQEILLSPQNRSSRNAHPWKTQALQPAEISSFCKWLPRMLIRYEGHLWARNWTSPASRIQRKELQPAGDASVQPCRLQKNAHLEPTTGVCFYYQSHNSRTTEYKSMDYFLFQTDASSGLSPQKRLFQVPAALGFYLKDLYLIYCWRQAGERLPYLPQPTGKGLMTKSHCSCLQLPLSLTLCVCTNTHHTAANLHSDPNHTAYLPTLQEPKHHCSGFLLLLDFTAFRYHCGAILSWKVFSLILTITKC